MDSINAVSSQNALNALNQTNEISFQTIHTNVKSNRPDKTAATSFEGFFDAALKLLDETNRLQLIDERMQLDYAAGKTDDILAVVMAQQKAYSSLNFTVTVTNKIIEAYREIMRISV